jgi:hypothetical protein
VLLLWKPTNSGAVLKMDHQFPYSANILITNFHSDAETLQFQHFSIHKVTYRNWEQAKQKFPGCQVYHNGAHYYIQRNYEEVPPRPNDYVGLGGIPYESEDLMLSLRLFKPENISFIWHVIQTPNGPLRQYPYPQVFSELHSLPHYTLKAEECASFDTFFTDAPTWPGWKSAWFNVSHRYFLWGSSKEFNIGREHIEDWELERILDYYTALEAAIVPEHDFVSRRLRERAAVLLQISGDDAETLKKRLATLSTS